MYYDMQTDKLYTEDTAMESSSNKKSGLEKFLDKHGIKTGGGAEHRATIGFSEKEQKWYGWSHRAIYGFSVGDKIKKGDIVYDTLGETTLKTLDECKNAAIEFSKAVS